MNNGFKYTHRGDAENAEVAQRISNVGVQDDVAVYSFDPVELVALAAKTPAPTLDFAWQFFPHHVVGILE